MIPFVHFLLLDPSSRGHDAALPEGAEPGIEPQTLNTFKLPLQGVREVPPWEGEEAEGQVVVL